jgi:Domain of unknown function (DUF4111)
MATNPSSAVLNLCSLLYRFKMGRAVTSKSRATNWALRAFRPKWAPLIRSAIRTSTKTGTKKDIVLLRSNARKFLGFAMVRAVAFDSVQEYCSAKTASHRTKGRISRK